MKAVIPVLKIEATPQDLQNKEQLDLKTLVKIDLVVDTNDNPLYESTSFRTTKYIASCVDTIPSMKAVIVTLKYVLNIQGLCNTYTGGINAYGLCVLY